MKSNMATFSIFRHVEGNDTRFAGPCLQQLQHVMCRVQCAQSSPEMHMPIWSQPPVLCAVDHSKHGMAG